MWDNPLWNMLSQADIPKKGLRESFASQGRENLEGSQPKSLFPKLETENGGRLLMQVFTNKNFLRKIVDLDWVFNWNHEHQEKDGKGNDTGFPFNCWSFCGTRCGNAQCSPVWGSRDRTEALPVWIARLQPFWPLLGSRVLKALSYLRTFTHAVFFPWDAAFSFCPGWFFVLQILASTSPSRWKFCEHLLAILLWYHMNATSILGMTIHVYLLAYLCVYYLFHRAIVNSACWPCVLSLNRKLHRAGNMSFFYSPMNIQYPAQQRAGSR